MCTTVPGLNSVPRRILPSALFPTQWGLVLSPCDLKTLGTRSHFPGLIRQKTKDVTKKTEMLNYQLLQKRMSLSWYFTSRKGMIRWHMTILTLEFHCADLYSLNTHVTVLKIKDYSMGWQNLYIRHVLFKYGIHSKASRPGMRALTSHSPTPAYTPAPIHPMQIWALHSSQECSPSPDVP